MTVLKARNAASLPPNQAAWGANFRAFPERRGLPCRRTGWHDQSPGTVERALAQLKTAEQAAVATLMSRLGVASPSLAQLYASIAASESTHASVLGAKAGA